MALTLFRSVSTVAYTKSKEGEDNTLQRRYSIETRDSKKRSAVLAPFSTRSTGRCMK